MKLNGLDVGTTERLAAGIDEGVAFEIPPGRWREHLRMGVVVDHGETRARGTVAKARFPRDQDVVEGEFRVARGDEWILEIDRERDLQVQPLIERCPDEAASPVSVQAFAGGECDVAFTVTVVWHDGLGRTKAPLLQ